MGENINEIRKLRDRLKKGGMKKEREVIKMKNSKLYVVDVLSNTVVLTKKFLENASDIIRNLHIAPCPPPPTYAIIFPTEYTKERIMSYGYSL